MDYTTWTTDGLKAEHRAALRLTETIPLSRNPNYAAYQAAEAKMNAIAAELARRTGL